MGEGWRLIKLERGLEPPSCNATTDGHHIDGWSAPWSPSAFSSPASRIGKRRRIHIFSVHKLVDERRLKKFTSIHVVLVGFYSILNEFLVELSHLIEKITLDNPVIRFDKAYKRVDISSSPLLKENVLVFVQPPRARNPRREVLFGDLRIIIH